MLLPTRHSVKGKTIGTNQNRGWRWKEMTIKRGEKTSEVMVRSLILIICGGFVTVYLSKAIQRHPRMFFTVHSIFKIQPTQLRFIMSTISQTFMEKSTVHQIFCKRNTVPCNQQVNSSEKDIIFYLSDQQKWK